MAQLNLDVLREICGHLTDVSDVLSFSLVCSNLRPVAIKRRLSMRAITIDGEESLRDLYNFTFVDEKRRGPYIDSIITPMTYDKLSKASDELVNQFVAVLACATRARMLSFHVPPEPWSLFGHPRILSAAAEMTSLQELGVVAPTDVANVLLGSTRSPLKTFRQSDIYQDWQCESLFSISPHLTSTLEEIELPFDLLEMAFKSHTSLPTVRSVTLTTVGHPFQLDMVLGVFPNVDRSLVMEDHIYSHDNLESRREENRNAQKIRRWKALDRVATSPVLLYSLGLTSPIRHLTLQVMREPDRDSLRDPQITRAILKEYAPTHLALINIMMAEDISILEDLFSLFPSEDVTARDKLTHLVLNVDYINYEFDSLRGVTGGIKELSWDSVLDAFLVGLQVLRPTHVRIVIDSRIDGRYGPFSSTGMYEGLRSFKFDRLVTALPHNIPSLSHIFITSAGELCNIGDDEEGRETWDVSRAWCVQRPGAGTQGPVVETRDFQAEELSAEAEEAAIDREEMSPTKRTEWVVFRERSGDSDSDDSGESSDNNSEDDSQDGD